MPTSAVKVKGVNLPKFKPRWTKFPLLVALLETQQRNTVHGDTQAHD